MSLHFSTPHPADGRALRYHFDEFMLDWIRELVGAIARGPKFDAAAEELSREAVLMYLEQLLAIELHPVGHELYRARYAASRGQVPQPVAVPAPLAELIRQSKSAAGVRVVSPAVADWQRAYRRARTHLRQLLIRTLPAPSTANAVDSTIAVELVEGANPAGKCDAFWLASGSIDPARVLFVLEPQNRTLVDVAESAAAVRRLGARLISVDPLIARKEGINWWKPAVLPAWADAMRGRLKSLPRSASGWLDRSLQRLARRVGFWEAFFRAHGVQAVQQFTEFSDETIAKRIAIGRVGGIELGKQRSQFFERASAAFYFRHEVVLLWHRNALPFLVSGGTGARYAVETGYVYGHLIDTLRAEGQALRSALAVRGATEVIAIFDAQAHPNTHFSLEQLRSFYGVALALARNRPQLGLIVKSKKPGIIASLGEEAREIEHLSRAGRCLIVDQPLTSVLSAALAADVALGFPASTAACEAALAGCRVLLYDPSHSRLHPWAARDAGIMFQELEPFAAAAVRALDEAASGSRGTPRPRLLEIDPFLDHRAAQRAAEFLNAFLSARAGGASKDASVASALRRCSHAIPVT